MTKLTLEEFSMAQESIAKPKKGSTVDSSKPLTRKVQQLARASESRGINDVAVIGYD